MTRAAPKDASMSAGCRVDKKGSAVGFEDLHVWLPRTEHDCPRCGKPMTGHGSYGKEMAYAAGHAPRRLTVTVPRSRCKRCGITVSEDIPFAPAASPNVTAAPGKRVFDLPGQRAIVKEAAALSCVPYDTVRPPASSRSTAASAHTSTPARPGSSTRSA